MLSMLMLSYRLEASCAFFFCLFPGGEGMSEDSQEIPDQGNQSRLSERQNPIQGSSVLRRTGYSYTVSRPKRSQKPLAPPRPSPSRLWATLELAGMAVLIVGLLWIGAGLLLNTSGVDHFSRVTRQQHRDSAHLDWCLLARVSQKRGELPEAEVATGKQTPGLSAGLWWNVCARSADVCLAL